MTTRASYLALAERAERAEGADRELDAAIVWRLTPGIIGIERGPLGHPDGPSWLFVWEPARSWSDSWHFVPAYTASLDAALSLVPEGRAWTLGQNVHHRYWAASVNALSADGEPQSVGWGQAATPALALVAAALRARAEEAKDGD